MTIAAKRGIWIGLPGGAFALWIALSLAGPIHALALPSASDSTPTPDATASVSATMSIGASLRGQTIVLERFGSGSRHILIIAGIHGDEYGIPVAGSFAKYLRAHPSLVASGTQIDLIVCANPDGRALKRRGNARGVDLNRNFPTSSWTRKHRRGTLSHGSSPASEPETKAIVRLMKAQRYSRVLALHSAGGLLDHGGTGSLALAKRVSKAAHVPIVSMPGSYPGSMGGYVAKTLHRPSVIWELSSRTLTRRVRAGLLAWLR